MRKFVSKDIQMHADDYVGFKGELWVSEDNTILRVGDNSTPGGGEISVGTASSLANGNAVLSLSANGTVSFPDIGNVWTFDNDGTAHFPQLKISTNSNTSPISMGYLAGQTDQAENSIVINATGTAVQNTVAGTVVIKPMRGINITTGFYQVYYNPTTGEMVYYQL